MHQETGYLFETVRIGVRAFGCRRSADLANRIRPVEVPLLNRQPENRAKQTPNVPKCTPEHPGILARDLQKQFLSVRRPKVPKPMVPASGLELRIPHLAIAPRRGRALLVFGVREIDALNKRRKRLCGFWGVGVLIDRLEDFFRALLDFLRRPLQPLMGAVLRSSA